MKTLLPPMPMPFGMREPRYSKTDEEMQTIATERAAARLNAVLDVIKRADPIFLQLTVNDAAASTLHLASTIFDSELGRVHLECAIFDENMTGSGLGLVD